MARLRNHVEDAPVPQESAADPSTPTTPGEGSSAEDEVAELREVDGNEDRHATPDEAQRTPPPPNETPSVSQRPHDAVATTAQSPDDSPSRRGRPAAGEAGGRRAEGGGVMVAPGETLVSDEFGSFAVPRPAPAGSGAGSRGGVASSGPGSGLAGLGRRRGAAGALGGGAEQSEGQRGGPDLQLSYSNFVAIYGEEELERQRRLRLEERRSSMRGARREREWREFQAAMENYASEVTPGNQTALNAAADPFATFLNRMHDRIHREFADRYLGSLGLDPTRPENDPNLRTTLEIAVNPDGTIHRVTILATSGQILYDYAAFRSVFRAQPFPEPPHVILSGDGHAWLHWHFDRGPRACGTWNAEPYLLRNRPAGPVDILPGPGDDDADEGG